jgi:hypothetical protein
MRLFLPIAVVVIGLSPSGPTLNLDSADLRPSTLQAWEGYDRAVHARVDAELQSTRPFLVLDRIPAADQRRAASSLAAGSVFITRLPGPNLKGPAPEIPDGLVHHWLGVVRIPRARLDDVLGFVQRYDDHARFFSDVVASKLIRRDGDDFEVFLKLRRQKVVTVFYNTTHLVSYRRLGPTHAASRSVTAKIAELADAGGPNEREKPVGHDSGYLWRLNSYWRFVEINGGVTAECESISLSRDIPLGFGWILHGIVDGIARESVEQTLDSIRKGVQKESMIPAK